MIAALKDRIEAACVASRKSVKEAWNLKLHGDPWHAVMEKAIAKLHLGIGIFEAIHSCLDDADRKQTEEDLKFTHEQIQLIQKAAAPFFEKE